MNKVSTDPTTDDARASDSEGAKKRRSALARDAKKGINSALVSEPVNSEDGIRKSAAWSAVGTAAEGMVEDGEGSSPTEIRTPVSSL
jgi:hypothetical protein